MERRWRSSRRSSTTAGEKAGDRPGAPRRAGPSIGSLGELEAGASSPEGGGSAEGLCETGLPSLSWRLSHPRERERAVFNATSLCALYTVFNLSRDSGYGRKMDFCYSHSDQLTIGPPGFEPGTARVLGPCSCKAWGLSSASSGASRGQLSG